MPVPDGAELGALRDTPRRGEIAARRERAPVELGVETWRHAGDRDDLLARSRSGVAAHSIRV